MKMVKLLFQGRNLADLDFWSKSDPYLVLSRLSKSGEKFIKVRKTEIIKNNLNPEWKILYLPLMELCDGDYYMRLKIDVWDFDYNSPDDLIGQAEVQKFRQMLNHTC